jgi:hypothetical protein
LKGSASLPTETTTLHRKQLCSVNQTSISEKTSEHEYSRLISSFISGSYGGLELVFDEYLRLDRAANGWVTEEESHDDTPGFSQAWREDVANILLGHAHIYVFASKYMILKLQYLSLHKMHTFLADLRIFPLTRGPVIELIRYIYNNENISDRGEEEIGVDLLRNLVIRFVSLHRKEFKWFPGHRAALKQNSEYALDFLDYTEHMLLEIESIVDELKDNGEGELEQKDGEEDLSY